MWGSRPGARAPGKELPALRAYCAVSDATSRANGDHKKSYVLDLCFTGPKLFTALGIAREVEQINANCR
ncbi:hypothetical protein LF1_02260 [Rubripirellula obstinata]|uniref:Uncharacterized protein n=1 Tax=Rubripirellula obstinata TaxID=406547 RepID=A0A5B1C9D2_9BACT|nr:hypothetical protein LF1_02260 [Rubripirellula obstinata]